MSDVLSSDEIVQQMCEVRRELGDDVQELAESARVLTDWRHYVHQYPWACLGAAALLGYFATPARIVVRHDARDVVDLLEKSGLVVKGEGPTKPAVGMLGFLAGSASQLAMNVGMNLLRDQVLPRVMHHYQQVYTAPRQTPVRTDADDYRE